MSFRKTCWYLRLFSFSLYFYIFFFFIILLSLYLSPHLFLWVYLSLSISLLILLPLILSLPGRCLKSLLYAFRSPHSCHISGLNVDIKVNVFFSPSLHIQFSHSKLCLEKRFTPHLACFQQEGFVEVTSRVFFFF